MKRDSLHSLMRYPLFVAQCCALLPVSGISAKSSNKISFALISPRMIYTVLVWSMMLVNSYATWIAEGLDDTPLSILNARLLEAVAPPLIFFPVFLLFSYKWGSFVHKWELVETKFSNFGSLLDIKFKLKAIFVFFIASGLGFLFLDILRNLWQTVECLTLESPVAYLKSSLLLHYARLYQVTWPAWWKSVVLLVIEALIALQWVSCNLIITYLSTILTIRFRQLNHNLDAYKLQMMPVKYWQEMRDMYNSLSQLTSLLDSLLSPMVLATFIMETLNIIVYIYSVINSPGGVSNYLVIAMGFLKVIVVNCITQFSISSIYEESKRPLEVFSLVPSVSYCKDVKRLYEQVTTDTLALSGCQFFYVTRSVILTMVSTIVTYEVVLIQFGSYEPEYRATNSNLPWYCDFWVIPSYKLYSSFV